jgi:hypothetical protein
LEKIVPAAYDGRVETLFVAAGVQQLGVFNRALLGSRVLNSKKAV